MPTRFVASVAMSLVGTAIVLTIVHALAGDVAWWREGVWVKTWVGIGVLTAIPTGARNRR